MAITFSCQCGRTLKARDELAGKRATCPQCGNVLTIPEPEPEVAPSGAAPAFDEDGGSYGLQDPDPAPSYHDDETEPSALVRPRARARAPFARDEDDDYGNEDGSAGASS